MLKAKLLIVALTLSLSSCGAYAVEPVGKDGRTFQFTEEEAQTCKEGGGCTIATNDALKEDAAMIMLLMQTVGELQKQLRAEKSKRCI
jgi:hypothetical protein